MLLPFMQNHVQAQKEYTAAKLTGERKCHSDCNCQFVASWYESKRKEIKKLFSIMDPTERESTIKGRIADAVKEHPPVLKIGELADIVSVP